MTDNRNNRVPYHVRVGDLVRHVVYTSPRQSREDCHGVVIKLLKPKKHSFRHIRVTTISGKVQDWKLRNVRLIT